MKQNRTIATAISSAIILIIAYFMCMTDALYSVSNPIAGQTYTSHSSIYDCVFGDMFNFGSLSAFILMTISFLTIGLLIFLWLKKPVSWMTILPIVSGVSAIAAGILYFLVLNFLTFRNVTPYIGFGSIFVGVLCIFVGLNNILNAVLVFIGKRRDS